MSLYESTFIIRHDMSTQQVEQMAEDFSEIIKNNGGEVTKTEHWGLKTLAYRVKKNRKGHYVLFNIDAPSAAMQELERNLRLSEDVLRFLTVRVDELDDAPSPMMQARASRDDRSRRGGHPHDEGEGGDRVAVKDSVTDDAVSPEAKPEAEPEAEAKPEAEPEAEAEAEAEPEAEAEAEDTTAETDESGDET